MRLVGSKRGTSRLRTVAFRVDIDASTLRRPSVGAGSGCPPRVWARPEQAYHGRAQRLASAGGPRSRRAMTQFAEA
jgi:hypothetical protein